MLLGLKWAWKWYFGGWRPSFPGTGLELGATGFSAVHSIGPLGGSSGATGRGLSIPMSANKSVERADADALEVVAWRFLDWCRHSCVARNTDGRRDRALAKDMIERAETLA